MKIKVTQAHIIGGEPNLPYACPIALALKAMGYRYPFVGCDGIEVDNYKYKLPEEALEFIENFDHSKEVQPFEFDLVDKWD